MSPRFWITSFLSLGLLLSACGGGATTSAPTTTTGAAAPSAAAFRSCMTAHGIPSSALAGLGRGRRAGASGSASTTLPPGVTSQQLRSARQACRGDLPSRRGGAGGLGAGPRAAAYRSCLKQHGVTLPSRTAGAPPVSIDRTSPAFVAARQACAALLPSGGSTGSTSTTSAAS
ncbi:MAG: hypothetical protein ACYC1D_04230 [Acidimicrobiales bacterium]